jgi:hypothetical protein
VFVYLLGGSRTQRGCRNSWLFLTPLPKRYVRYVLRIVKHKTKKGPKKAWWRFLELFVRKKQTNKTVQQKRPGMLSKLERTLSGQWQRVGEVFLWDQRIHYPVVLEKISSVSKIFFQIWELKLYWIYSVRERCHNLPKTTVFVVLEFK